MRDLRLGDVFIDIGANAGLFSLLASERVGVAGRVFAFEPNADVFSRLGRNLEVNGCANVTAMNAAIADRAGFRCLERMDARHTGLAHLAPGGEDGEEDQTEAGMLRVRTLDRGALAFLRDACAGKRAFVKVDVEGAEVLVLKEVLACLAAALPERIIVEVDGGHLARFGVTCADLYALLASYGYAGTVRQPGRHYDELFVRS